MQSDALEKRCYVTEHLKIVKNGHQHTKTTEDEKVYMLNKCLYSN